MTPKEKQTGEAQGQGLTQVQGLAQAQSQARAQTQGLAQQTQTQTQGPAQQTQAPLDFALLQSELLKPWLPFLFGNRLGNVVAVKGIPGQAERAGRPPFFGADGEALTRGLEALGWEGNSWCGIAAWLGDDAHCLRLVIEMVDPWVILALDHVAMTALQESFGAHLLPSFPTPGTRVKLLGRTLVYLDGFEAALAAEDEGKAKRRVWRQLKAASPKELID